VGSLDNYVYALSGKDGSLMWKFKTGDYIRSSPALGDLDKDGYLDVVVGSGDRYVYALSGKDGSLMWKFGTGYSVQSSPALGDLDGDGYIDMAVVSWDGYLYVFESRVKGGRVVWSRWHGDASGTGLYENAVSFAKFNLSGKAFAWRPEVDLSKMRFVGVGHIRYRASSNDLIERTKRKKAYRLALEVARTELKKKLAEEVKKTVERLFYEAEISDKKLARTVYNKVLSEIFKEVDTLRPVKVEIKRGELKLTLVGDSIALSIENRIAPLVVKALEGKKIVFKGRVEIPKITLSASQRKDFKILGESPKREKTQATRKCVRPNPNYYFFGVVVYDYDEITDLEYVKNDKELVYKLATCYMGVPEENVKILENPAYVKLKRELRKFARSVKKKDATLYFYYSGHGVTDSKGKFYILPADASVEDEQVLRESGINIYELKKLLARARGKKVAFIDACRIEPSWKPAVVVYKPKLTDTAIIFSTKEGQLSNSDREKRYSAFTRALYEMASSGLVNLDFDDDGYVEIKELIKPLTKWVRKVSADERQSPDVWGPKDFEVFPVE